MISMVGSIRSVGLKPKAFLEALLGARGHLYLGLVFAFLAGAQVSSAEPEVVFYENFEGLYSGEALQRGLNAQFNDRVFIWESDMRARVVPIQEAAASHAGLEAAVPINNSKVAGSLAASRSGPCVDCALRFYYPSGENSFAEQRFRLNPVVAQSLGVQGVREIWLQYDIFIPSNYFHRDLLPEEDLRRFAGGEKLGTFFADEYSHPNPTFIMGKTMMRRESGNPGYQNDGSSYIGGTFSFYQDGERKYEFFRQSREGIVIDVARDRGRWQRRTIRVKLPSGSTSNDGVVEFWVRHGDGSVTKVIDFHEGKFFSPDQDYLNGGYLLGWSNTGFNEDTYFLIDNIIITNRAKNVDLSGVDFGVRPKAPELIVH